MSIILFDNSSRNLLQPFTLTRAVGDLRMGIFTGVERWQHLLGKPVLVHTTEYLQEGRELISPDEPVWIDAAVIPTRELAALILALGSGQSLVDEAGALVAGRGLVEAGQVATGQTAEAFPHSQAVNVRRLVYPWQMTTLNDEMIRFDFHLATKGRTSAPLPATVNVIAPENIFLEEGAKLSYCTINASTGPVYIGRNAEIMEGATIRGPFVLGENSVVKMNSRIYGATTLGPNCIGGGEIKNAILMANSNKAHDGYLGDSVVGEWCNFGAGSSNSNIKNTAGTVKIWSFAEQEAVPAGQKCGLVMGDYSRVSINASINTGSMIGVCANVFGEGLLPACIHHFSWGVKGNTYTLEKALLDIDNWKKLKNQHLTEEEEKVLRNIFANL